MTGDERLDGTRLQREIQCPVAVIDRNFCRKGRFKLETKTGTGARHINKVGSEGLHCQCIDHRQCLFACFSVEEFPDIEQR